MDLQTHIAIHVLEIKWGETLVTKILLHGIFKWFEKNVAAQRISPRTRTILSKVRFQQVQTVTYNYLPVTICIHCIWYYICTNLQHFISVNLQWESILKLNSVLMTYCKKLSQRVFIQKFSKVRDKLEQHINSCAVLSRKKIIKRRMNVLYVKNSVTCGHGPSICTEVVLAWRVMEQDRHCLELWRLIQLENMTDWTEVQVEQS